MSDLVILYPCHNPINLDWRITKATEITSTQLR